MLEEDGFFFKSQTSSRSKPTCIVILTTCSEEKLIQIFGINIFFSKSWVNRFLSNVPSWFTWKQQTKDFLMFSRWSKGNIWKERVNLFHSWSIEVLITFVLGLNQKNVACLSQIKLCRSSHWRFSVRKGILRNFAKFIGKHLCQSLFFNKVIGLWPATSLKKDSGTVSQWILPNF